MMGNSDHGKLGLTDQGSAEQESVQRVAATYRPVLAEQRSKKGILEIKDGDKVLKIKQVSCGFKHTACVTEDGVLYTWGEGRNGQLGHNSDFKDRLVPTKIEMTVKVEKVLCGANHTVFMDD